MASALLLIFMNIIQGLLAEKVPCDGAIFNYVYYDQEWIVGSLGKPNNLVMHKFSGLLFFSHTVQNGTHVDFKITTCHVETRNCTDIKGVPGGYAIGYDAGNDDVYLGGHDGIYKYNFLTKTADFFAEEGKSIWALFVKKNFYYIEYPNQKLHVYQNDDFVPVAEAIKIEIDCFFISKRFDVYYSNRTALYKVEKPRKEPIVMSDEVAIRQIVEDSYGDIYFCASDGIYLEDKPFYRIKKVADISQAFGLTFDERDQIIFSDEAAIYRLVPSKYQNLCFTAINKPQDTEDETFEDLMIS